MYFKIVKRNVDTKNLTLDNYSRREKQIFRKYPYHIYLQDIPAIRSRLAGIDQPCAADNVKGQAIVLGVTEDYLKEIVERIGGQVITHQRLSERWTTQPCFKTEQDARLYIDELEPKLVMANLIGKSFYAVDLLREEPRIILVGTDAAALEPQFSKFFQRK